MRERERGRELETGRLTLTSKLMSLIWIMIFGTGHLTSYIVMIIV